jgi:hypothetical protein
MIMYDSTVRILRRRYSYPRSMLVSPMLLIREAAVASERDTPHLVLSRSMYPTKAGIRNGYEDGRGGVSKQDTFPPGW